VTDVGVDFAGFNGGFKAVELDGHADRADLVRVVVSDHPAAGADGGSVGPGQLQFEDHRLIAVEGLVEFKPHATPGDVVGMPLTNDRVGRFGRGQMHPDGRVPRGKGNPRMAALLGAGRRSICLGRGHGEHSEASRRATRHRVWGGAGPGRSSV